MRALAIALLAAAAAGSAFGAEKPEPVGRYELQPTAGGFLRLDKDTGATAFCKPAGEGYACEPTAEGGAAEPEVARLEKRIAALERRIDAISSDGLPPVPALPKDDQSSSKHDGGSLDLPSDDQLDRIASFLQRALKRLKGIVEDAEKDPGSQDRQRL